MQKFVQRGLVRIFRNEHSRSTPLDPKLIFWCVSFRLGAFGTVLLLHETRCKWANLVQLMQEFVPQSLVRISWNRRSRSTQFDPKLMFSCVSFHLGAFGTISLLHETCCKMRQTGAINAKVRATKSCQIFSQQRSRSTPLDPKLMFWCVSFRLGAIGTVLLLHKICCKTRQTSAINAKVRATMSC